MEKQYTDHVSLLEAKVRKNSKSYRSLFGLLTFAVISALPASDVQAQLGGTPAITISDVGNTGEPNSLTYGFEFSISTAITVSDLGYFDFEQDGLSRPHQVGIWDSTGTLLASATVPAGEGATLAGGRFRFVSLSVPVTLLTGQNYIVGGHHNPSASDRYGFDATISTAPEITYVRDRFSSSSGPFGYPDASTNFTSTSSAAFFGANFAFQPFSAIPEPSTALAAMGLLGLSAMSRWRSGRAPAL